MKTILLIVFITFMALPASAATRVVTTFPYIADLAERIGGNRVEVSSLATGKWDPHHVVPKPSLIAQVRQADMLIINGAELEIGWLPPVIRDSRNSRIQPGARGFLDLSGYVKLIDVPETVSRSMGDIHPSGNPHFFLDPVNMPKLAGAIAKKLCQVDGAGCPYYQANLKRFTTRWNARMNKWDRAMASLKGTRVVQYHKNYNYFYRRYGIICEMELEPLPGIPPTSSHTRKVVDYIKRYNIKYIISDVYRSMRPVRFVADRTGARIVILPHDVGSVEGAATVFTLFDEMVGRLTR